ncbi:unnamed protein product [Effrenium voratum]|nr:unnamed protein product [Effrenium voratum]
MAASYTLLARDRWCDNRNGAVRLGEDFNGYSLVGCQAQCTKDRYCTHISFNQNDGWCSKYATCGTPTLEPNDFPQDPRGWLTFARDPGEAAPQFYGDCSHQDFQVFKTRASNWYEKRVASLRLFHDMTLLVNNFQTIYSNCPPGALLAVLLKLESAYFEEEEKWNTLLEIYINTLHAASAAGEVVASHYANGWPLQSGIQEALRLRRLGGADRARSVSLVVCYCCALGSFFPFGVSVQEFAALWKAVFGSSVAPSLAAGEVNAYCCVQFMVKRERILQRPKSFYWRGWRYFGLTAESYHRLFPVGRVVRGLDVLGRTPGQLAMYIWHVIFGEPMRLPRRQRDPRLPLFMKIQNIEVEALDEEGESSQEEMAQLAYAGSLIESGSNSIAARLGNLFALRFASGFAVVGYVPDYRWPGLDWHKAVDLTTHLVLFSLEPTLEGLQNTDGLRSLLKQSPLPKAMEAAKSPPKLLVSVGGAGRSKDFAAVAASKKHRKRLVKQLLHLLQEFPLLSGVDFDWQVPSAGSEDWLGLGKMALMLRTALGTRGGEAPVLTMTFHAHSGAIRSFSQLSFKPQEKEMRFVEIFDMCHAMTYTMMDAHGRHSSDKVDSDVVQAWLRTGLPPDRLTLGMPFFGVKNGATPISFSDIVYKETALLGDPARDKSEEGFFFVNVASAKKKVSFAEDQGLAGIMIWELGQDLVQDHGSLLRHIWDAAYNKGFLHQIFGIRFNEDHLFSLLTVLLGGYYAAKVFQAAMQPQKKPKAKAEKTEDKKDPDEKDKEKEEKEE